MKSSTSFAAQALLALVAVFAASTLAQAIDVDSSTYAAVAYSPSTGEYHYSYNYGSRSSAQQAALKSMTAEDARIVCWANRGFCALALGDDKSYWGTGWSFGDGASNTEAMNRALEECRNRTTGARVVLCLVSDGQYIYEFKPAAEARPY